MEIILIIIRCFILLYTQFYLLSFKFQLLLTIFFDTFIDVEIITLMTLMLINIDCIVQLIIFVISTGFLVFKLKLLLSWGHFIKNVDYFELLDFGVSVRSDDGVYWLVDDVGNVFVKYLLPMSLHLHLCNIILFILQVQFIFMLNSPVTHDPLLLIILFLSHNGLFFIHYSLELTEKYLV